MGARAASGGNTEADTHFYGRVAGEMGGVLRWGASRRRKRRQRPTWDGPITPTPTPSRERRETRLRGSGKRSLSTPEPQAGSCQSRTYAVARPLRWLRDRRRRSNAPATSTAAGINVPGSGTAVEVGDHSVIPVSDPVKEGAKVEALSNTTRVRVTVGTPDSMVAVPCAHPLVGAPPLILVSLKSKLANAEVRLLLALFIVKAFAIVPNIDFISIPFKNDDGVPSVLMFETVIASVLLSPVTSNNKPEDP